ncbi:hypothetical protein [Salmonirosea aquatica]|uniref:Por secretion system C-terminal sorting domain-containing protein n=1 Tax=Salmonirosea aquatica TaxID=2654236 RepID=A0A7C9FYD8_9BACT|nr:hypothetical protein [Cytophagaceae bacterium SJW1-29]
MKRIILVAAVWMGVSAANLATANSINPSTEVRTDGTVDMSVETFKDMKFKLTIKNLSNRSYIAIKRSTGETLYSEYASKTESYTKVFDLSNLADGKYAFVIESGNGNIEKPFTISTETTRTVTPISAE